VPIWPIQEKSLKKEAKLPIVLDVALAINNAHFSKDIAQD
jgi:hypothetical protein